MPEPTPPTERPPNPLIRTFPDMNCVYCGKHLEAGVSPGLTPPPPLEPGTFMLCLGCLQPNVYQHDTGGGPLRKANPEELAEFAVDSGDVVEALRRARSRPEAQ